MDTITQLMNHQAPKEGVNPSRLPGIFLYRASWPAARQPLCYQRGIIIVGQGTKQVYLGDRTYVYDPDNYLVLSVPLPAECDTRCTPESPMLSMFVDLDLDQIRELIGELPEQGLPPASEEGDALALAKVTQEIRDVTLRLLRALLSDLESRVMGPALVRELMFRVLMGENSRALRSLIRQESRISRVDKALNRIHDNYAAPMDVAELAALVHMSPSAFHRAFKEVTASSPIQYLKKIRLDKAKGLLLDQGMRVSEAAVRVGYESPNQFSREFKRYFGASPVSFSSAP